jgi:hypothetical protein
MKKNKKGKQWDGRSRISTKQYKQNYDDIFKKQTGVVRTEASFVSRDATSPPQLESKIKK